MPVKPSDTRRRFLALPFSTWLMLRGTKFAEASTPRRYWVYFPAASSAMSERGIRIAAEFASNHRMLEEAGGWWSYEPSWSSRPLMFTEIKRVDVKIVAYAPDLESPQQSEALGFERARAIAAVLIGLGVPEERITSLSMGIRRPPIVFADQPGVMPDHRAAEIQMIHVPGPNQRWLDEPSGSR